MNDLITLYCIFSFVFVIAFCWRDWRESKTSFIDFVYYSLAVMLAPAVLPLILGINHRGKN
mgnify:CR=1 FL=1